MKCTEVEDCFFDELKHFLSNTICRKKGTWYMKKMSTSDADSSNGKEVQCSEFIIDVKDVEPAQRHPKCCIYKVPNKLRERVEAFSFKDSYIGGEPALYVYSEKDNKEAKPSTLITHPPIIGEFSPNWDWDICPPNLPQWSQAAPQNVDASTILLLASHYTNIASTKP
nr:hypothetical protein CFP56_51247 [Quercus suber]